MEKNKMTYCPTLSAARKAYPWLNPNGFAIKEIAKTDAALTKVSNNYTRASEKEYRAWYENTHGQEYKSPNSGQHEFIDMQNINAKLKFRDVPESYFRIMMKKMKKDKMTPEILHSYVAAGITRVTGYAL